MQYRNSPEWFRACAAAAAQRAQMNYRTGTLENVSGKPLKIRTRRTVR